MPVTDEALHPIRCALRDNTFQLTKLQAGDELIFFRGEAPVFMRNRRPLTFFGKTANGCEVGGSGGWLLIERAETAMAFAWMLAGSHGFIAHLIPDLHKQYHQPLCGFRFE